MKKLISLFLLCSCMLFLSLPVFAEGRDQQILFSGDYGYILLPDGSAEIIQHSGGHESEMIPPELDGHTVTTIGDYAFENGKGIKSISIPDTIISLGANPFAFCPDLVSIWISPEHPTLTVKDGVLIDKTDHRLICFPAELFTNFYTVPSEVEIIGERAFFNSQHLVTITIPENVKRIAESAFSVCVYLEKVTLLGGVEEIGDYAFHLCERLQSVTLSDSVTKIGRYAFLGCTKLKDLTIPEHTKDIGEGAFLQVPNQGG
jgi:hypothetical protein